MITIYTKDDCRQCKMTKKLFDDANVSYKEINIDHETEYVDKLRELGFKAAPVIETATDTWAGFQPAKIKAEIKLQST